LRWRRLGLKKAVEASNPELYALRRAGSHGPPTIARVLEWDFEKIIVTHGTNIAGLGRDRFRQAVSEVGLLEARSGG